MIIGNYSYEQYINLPKDEQDEYARTISLATNFPKKDYIGHIDVEDWQFGDIKELMDLLESGKSVEFTEYIVKNIRGYNEKVLLGRRAYEVLLTFAYIVEKIGEMIETESKTLVSNIDNETRTALSQVDMTMFGYYPQLLELANNDPTRIDEVSKMKYSDAYVFLFYNTKKSELERAITNIYRRKR